MTDFLLATGAGRAYCSNKASWSAAHDPASADATDGTHSVRSSYSSTLYFIHRLFLPFDTRGIPAGSTINSASLKLYRDDGEYSFSNAQSTAITVVLSNEASPTSLATSDYSLPGTTSGGSINFSSTSNGSYATISLNATGLTWITANGYTLLAVRCALDISNTSPGGDNSIGFQNRTEANPPTLTISYTPPASNGAFFLFS